MKNYCINCEHREKCELTNNVNFCEDCKDYGTCDICTVDCEAGNAIECNNGFELKSIFDEDEEE